MPELAPPSLPHLTVEATASRQAAEAGHAEAAVRFAEKAHTNLQELVKVADAKAGALVTLQAVVFAIGGHEFLTALVGAIRNIASSPLGWVKLDIAFVVTALALSIATLSSAFYAVRTLYPRAPDHIEPPPKARGFLWITALAPFSEARESLSRGVESRLPATYVSELLAMDHEARTSELVFEQLKISWILRRKFKLLKRAMISLMIALVAGVATLAAWTAFAVKYVK